MLEYENKANRKKIISEIETALSRTEIYDSGNPLHRTLVIHSFTYSKSDMALCAAVGDNDCCIEVYERGQLIAQTVTENTDDVKYLIFEHVIKVLAEKKSLVKTGENTYILDSGECKREAETAFAQIGGVFCEWYASGRTFYNFLNWL